MVLNFKPNERPRDVRTHEWHRKEYAFLACKETLGHVTLDPRRSQEAPFGTQAVIHCIEVLPCSVSYYLRATRTKDTILANSLAILTENIHSVPPF